MSSSTAAGLSSQQFVAVLKQSQLLGEAELASVLRQWQRFPPDQLTPGRMAGSLVQAGLLTRFQAQQLLAGKSKGFLIAGKYRLLDVLGKGGMGKVYLCEHVRMKRKVALKILPVDQADEASTLQRFNREAQALAALKHPNIVYAFDLDSDGNRHFLVMEYVDGPGLDQLIKDRGALPVEEACGIIFQAACGLQHAYEEGWVHRDIKPSNLLIDSQGVVKILDLGLARFSEADHSVTRQFKEEAAIFGTADYIAPEQAMNSTNVDIRADIYSLGATLYHALAGHPPFPSGSATQKLLWHQMAEPAALESIRPKLPAGLASLVRMMMAKKPDYRFQTPYEVAEALAVFANIPPEALPEPREPVAAASAVRAKPTSEKMTGPASARLAQSRPANAGRSVSPSSSQRLTTPISSQTTQRHSSKKLRKPASGDLRRSKAAGRGVRGGLSALFSSAWTRLALVLLAAGLGISVLIIGLSSLTPRRGDEAMTLSPTGVTELLVEFPEEDTIINLMLKEKNDPRPTPYSTAKSRLLTVPPGDYEVSVVDLPRGFALDTKKVTVRKGARSVVTFSRVPVGEPIQETRRYEGHRDFVQSLAFAPDGKRFASGGGGQGTRTRAEASTDNAIKFWSIDRGDELAEIRGFSDAVTSLDFSADGNQVLAASREGTLRLYEVETSRELRRFRFADRATTPILSAIFLPDGKQMLAAGGDESTMSLWDLASEADSRKRFRGHQGLVHGVCVRPNKAEVLSVSSDRSFRLWRLDNREELAIFPQRHTGPIYAVAVSSDGKRAATAGEDGTVRIWDIDSRDQLRVLRGHGKRVNSVHFSPDGRRLASASDDRTARIWDAESGAELYYLAGHESEVTCVRFSPTGRHLVTGSFDRSVRLWKAP